MFIKTGIKQAFRTPRRLIAIFLVLALICAFLCISISTRQNVQQNIGLLQQEFNVLAVPRFMASVDRSGNITMNTSGDYQGYVEAPAIDYDLSVIENTSGVKDVLVHRQFGVYLPSTEDYSGVRSTVAEYYDVFIFTYDGVDPLTVKRSMLTDDAKDVSITIHWSALNMDRFPFYDRFGEGFRLHSTVDTNAANSLWVESLPELSVEDTWLTDDNGTLTGDLILQPGETYIASGYWYVSRSVTPQWEWIMGSEKLQSFWFETDQAHAQRALRYRSGGWNMEPQADAYHVSVPCVLPYHEGFWETDAGAYFRDAAETAQINARSLTAVSTSDLSLYLPFYQGNVYISEGRSFTKEEYTAGSKVCLVSEYLANENGWKIGDTLDLSFFKANYGLNGASSDVDSYYEPLIEVFDETSGKYTLQVENQFFSEGNYEIVGFYDGKVTKSAMLDEPQYTLKEGIGHQVIIVPEQSLACLPEVPLSQYNTTILLDDEKIMDFMSEMENSDLLVQKKGHYQLSLEIFDQGATGIKESLRQLDNVSRLTLYLACAAALAVIILLSVLITLQNRRQIATLRSLGVRKAQIPTAVLSGVLLVSLLGACLGSFTGYLVSDEVSQYIVATAQTDIADTSFSAMLAKDSARTEDAYLIALDSHPQSAVLAAAAVMSLFMLLSCTLILSETKKSPMLSLGSKE